MEIAKKNIKVKQLQDKIDRKENDFIKRYKDIKHDKTTDKTILDEYSKYYNNIISNKKLQEKHLDNLLKYLHSNHSDKYDYIKDYKQIDDTKKNINKQISHLEKI